MAPDTKIGDHTHEHDYLVIGVSEGELVVVVGEDDINFPVAPGVTVFGSKGDTHDVVNRADGEVRFLEIDLK
jgi:mannose-6-phosphate isomerase-like protein (cupin superfamily)